LCPCPTKAEACGYIILNVAAAAKQTQITRVPIMITLSALQ